MYQLKVNQQQSIIALHEQGWSGRRIARELGLDRGMVGKYLAGHSKPATNPQTGSGEVAPSKPAINPQTGSATVPGPASLCDPWREQIEAALERGLSIQRIYQDLVVERQFTGSYFAVRRFVLRRVNAQELPFRRMECAPGQELQVDFGLGAWVIENGKRRRPHLLRAVLSHSRKGYSEVVWRQTAESFLRCLENAFRHFGGVTVTVVPDYVPRHIIGYKRAGDTTIVSKRVFQTPDETLGRLPPDYLTVAFARMAQNDPKQMGPLPLAIHYDPCALAKIHLGFGSRFHFHPHKRHRLALAKLPHKPFYRLITADESMVADQVLINALGTQAHHYRRFDLGQMRLAKALATGG
jgi:transposase